MKHCHVCDTVLPPYSQKDYCATCLGYAPHRCTDCGVRVSEDEKKCWICIKRPLHKTGFCCSCGVSPVYMSDNNYWKKFGNFCRVCVRIVEFRKGKPLKRVL